VYIVKLYLINLVLMYNGFIVSGEVFCW